MRAILSAIGRALLTAAATVISLPFMLIDALLGRSQRQQEAEQTAAVYEQAAERVTDAELEAANRRDAAMVQKWCADREIGRPGDLTGFKRSTQAWLTQLDSLERQIVALAPPQAVRSHIAGFHHMRAIPQMHTKDFETFRGRHRADRAEIEAALQREIEDIVAETAPLPEAPTDPAAA